MDGNRERPTFDLVTGISTGALMAPFAFLGRQQDSSLRQRYTAYGRNDLLRSPGPFGLLQDALASSAPLKVLIDDYLSARLIAEIGREHRNRRRLFVVTSNLDSGHAIIWDMGAIAVAKEDDLFSAVTLASASIPGLFPPVTLYLGGKLETHLDGGVHLQLLGPPEAAFESIPSVNMSWGHHYVLVKNTLKPRPVHVRRRAIAIMLQVFTTMVRSAAAVEVQSSRHSADRAGLKFSRATNNADFDVPFDPSDRFSPVYMNALFRYGYARARAGKAWATG